MLSLFNIRYGHACNSSSSHSIIWFGGEPQSDETRHFGWEYFTAADPLSRRNYAALLVMEGLNLGPHDSWAPPPKPDANPWAEKTDAEYEAMEEDESDDYMSVFLKKAALRRIGVPVPPSGYIDHQSCEDFMLPTLRSWGTERPAWEFIQEFVSWFEHAPIAVLGGNDNSEEGVEHPLQDFTGTTDWGTPIRDPEQGLDFIGNMQGIARKDPLYGFWTLFNPRSGTKIRLNFQEPGQGVTTAPERSSLPDLIDLKLTGYCPYKCAFCYMGSTVEGRHGDTGFIKKIVDGLATAQVFEIAMGGGEPTLHPDFTEICQYIAQRNISCNFTTKSLGWLRDPVQAKPIVASCTAFAYSADNATDVEKAYDALVPYRGQIVCNIQVVVGAVSSWELPRILTRAKELGLPVTLLGFKITGRGDGFDQEKYDWLQIVKDAGYTSIGIDTVLAATLDGNEDVPDLFYHTKEGAWSMYIDATTRHAGPSSYCDPDKMVDLIQYHNHDKEKRFPRVGDLAEIFRSLQPE